MKFSQQALNKLKEFEGFRSKAFAQTQEPSCVPDVKGRTFHRDGKGFF